MGGYLAVAIQSRQRRLHSNATNTKRQVDKTPSYTLQMQIRVADKGGGGCCLVSQADGNGLGGALQACRAMPELARLSNHNPG
jgi:hypothetical protein